MQRRNFFKLMGAASAVAILPKISYGATPPPNIPKIVVVGGGPGGAAAAKYLKIWGGSNVNVILITPTKSYIAGMQSNLVVTGALNPNTITRNYNSLRTRGVKTRYAKVTGITIGSSGGTVTFTDSNLPNPNPDNLPNGHIDYDYLVLAPGVKFSPYTGDGNFELSYWQRDQATALSEFLDLKAKIVAMNSGDTFAMYVPNGPYKGSQAPFGRACVVANLRPDITVKVYDGKASLPLLFVEPFASLGIIYTPNTTLTSVNKVAKTININSGTIVSYNQANLIPTQKANLDFAPAALLAGGSFAPVDSQTFKSTVYDRVYVIGDASGVPLPPTTPPTPTSLPKSGHLAADQAKICASAITRRIAGLTNHPLETSLAVSAVQFNAIRSTPGHLAAVYAHAGYQWNAAAHDATHPFNGWMPSSSYPDAGVSASGAVPASSKNYSQGLTWVQTLLDDCFI